MIIESVINMIVNAKNAQKQIEQLKKDFNQTASDIKKSFVNGLGQALGAGSIIYGLKKVYDNIRDIDDLSARTNLPVEQISKFQGVLAGVGGTGEDAVNALSSVEEAIRQLRTTGQGPLLQVGSQIGLSMYNDDGQIKNSFDIIEDLRQKLKGLNDTAQITVLSELNLDSPAMLRMFQATDEEFAKLVKNADKFSKVNAKTVKVVRNIEKSLSLAKQTLMSGGISFFEGVQEGIERFGLSLDQSNEYVQAFQTILKSLGIAVSAFFRALLDIGTGIGEALFYVFYAISEIAKGIWGAAVLIGEAFASIFIGIGGAWDAIVSFFKSIPEMAYNAGKTIIESIGGAFDWVKEKAFGVFNKIVDYFKEKWEQIKSLPGIRFFFDDEEDSKKTKQKEKSILKTAFPEKTVSQMPISQMPQMPSSTQVQNNNYQENIESQSIERSSVFNRQPMKPVFNITINGGQEGNVYRELQSAIYNGTGAVVP